MQQNNGQVRGVNEKNNVNQTLCLGAGFERFRKEICQMGEKFAFQILGLYLDKLERVFRLDSKDLIKAYREKAEDCINRGRYGEAISACQKAIKLSPDDVEVNYQLGVAYMGDRLAEEAIGSFQKVLKLEPNHAGAHFRLGVLYEKTGAIDNAVASYKKAINLKPDQADFHYTLGVILDKKGDQKHAIESLNKAIELAPDVAKYHYRLGLLYDGQGQHEKAVDAFKKAVEAEEAVR
jgi:tetratricopeptide (TPR) repeat protein